ncbi:hypothetical protein, partial [Haemophilus haemolyticus]|uniref:hypothetical protein n=1 Tax=Haemophilus haemolyticus TaxID=726 RepID=UPI001AB023E7
MSKFQKQKPQLFNWGSYLLFCFALFYLFKIVKSKFVFGNLAVPYSHMGMPHTTIGITAFH